MIAASVIEPVHDWDSTFVKKMLKKYNILWRIQDILVIDDGP